MSLRARLHNLTHGHVDEVKDGMRVRFCHPRLRRHVYVFVQRWPGALWEPVETAADLSVILGVPMPGSEE